MTQSIYIVTRLDRLAHKDPTVCIAGSYTEKEQAYKNAMIFQLEQMLKNASNWSAQAIQHRRANILKRCHGIPTLTSYQAHFEHLFPLDDNLFDDLCNYSYQVHACPLDTTAITTPPSHLTESTLVQQLINIFQVDEEDLDDSNGDDDDEEEDEEDDDDEEEDLDDDDSEEVESSRNEPDESDEDEKQQLGSDTEGITMEDEIVDDEDESDDGQKQTWTNDEDEIDELNDDDDETINKRRKTTH